MKNRHSDDAILSATMALETLSAQSKSDAEPYSRAALNASTDCIKVMSPEGAMQFMNEKGLCQMQIDRFDMIDGKLWPELWPESAQQQVQQAIERAALGEATRFEAFCPTARGVPRWWDVNVGPILGADGRPESVIAISRDITERRETEQALATHIAEQEEALNITKLMMQEVHHRVRNSLQLVHSLLSLQGNMSKDESVKEQLRIAATRIMTIGSVHERLYSEAGLRQTEAEHYLNSLLSDLKSAFGDRDVVLTCTGVTLEDSKLSPIGLITAELVTNAFKYGKGRVTVTLTQGTDYFLLVVEDEGAGFPVDFPKPQGTGLGMRLVKSYAGFGADAITVDRSAPHSKIIIKIKR